ENYHVSQTDTPGVFGSLQNSISSFIREVEPAPVLGVSGGMGVLFLLFKYTPVGSFFGGRRGRFRQIPRSFNGPFPGDFANFQEYDGGFIGYGPMNPLAE
ncbi:PIR protein, partial [Plasmodium vivax]